jgi:hypothetical protein
MMLDGEQIINRLWDLSDIADSPLAKADIRNGLDLIEHLAEEVGRLRTSASRGPMNDYDNLLEQVMSLEEDLAGCEADLDNLRHACWELLEAMHDRHERPGALGTAVGNLRSLLNVAAS